MKVDGIIYDARLVTCAGAGGAAKKGAAMSDAGVINRGAVAFADGKIVAVGESDVIRRTYSSDDVFDARGKVAAPAFVECHTHCVYAGHRLDEFESKIRGAEYLEILAAGGGILSTVRETRRATLAALIAESGARLDKLLANGVTTCEVKTGYGLDTETELKMLAAIFDLNDSHHVDLIPTFLPAHAVPPEFAADAGAYVELICREMLPAAKRLCDARSAGDCFVDVFCEKNAFDLDQSRRVLETAKSLGFKLKAHVDEFTNLGGARMAIELGATSIDHLDCISDDEIRLLAASGTVGVVTPTVNFNFGSTDFADARKLVDAGCAVAVSTDYNPGSAPCPSLPNAMAIACRYQKLLPSEVFNAATINAACAVGAGDRAGSLEPGKQADIVIFDAADYREVVYEFGGNLVERVYQRGEIVKQ